VSKVKWSKVRRGDVVEAGGIAWTIEKIKTKGKGAKVTIRNGSRVAESKVKLADKVKMATAAPVAKQKKAKSKPTAPPAPATGDPWETQQDRIERKLDEILGARLVGEATDPEAGWYVPPPDVTTIASHLLLFHGGIPEVAHGDEAVMLRGHEGEHALALEGMPLHVNHWHTEKRPTTGKKKG